MLAESHKFPLGCVSPSGYSASSPPLSLPVVSCQPEVIALIRLAANHFHTVCPVINLAYNQSQRLCLV